MSSARRLPGTGALYREGEATLFPESIYVAGESPLVVEQALDHVVEPLGYKKDMVARGFREFTILRYIAPRREESFNLLISGIGSASVEVTLQEAYLCGARSFLMTGTCAGLRRSGGTSLQVGDLCVPSEALVRPGATSEYFPGLEKVVPPEGIAHSLREFVARSAAGRQVGEGRCLSVDAFYGVGASLDAMGVPSYAGGALNGGVRPASLSLAIDNPFDCEILDMEIATFLALGNALEGASAVALKVVSNPIPWDASFTVTSSDEQLAFVVQTAFRALRS